MNLRNVSHGPISYNRMRTRSSQGEYLRAVTYKAEGVATAGGGRSR